MANDCKRTKVLSIFDRSPRGGLILVLSILLAVSVAITSNAQSSNKFREMGTLEFGTDKEFRPTLGPGEVHLYHVPLEANQYVQIGASFTGVDGVITAYSPGGAKLEEVTAPNSTEELKELWWITKETGDYQIRIRGKSIQASGKYSIDIRELIQNVGSNAKRIRICSAVAEGWRLHEIGTREALLEAIPILQTAVSLSQEVGDIHYFQLASLYLGEVYHFLSEYRKAIQVYEPLLPLLPDPVDPTKGDPSWTYNNIASSYSALGERQKAREFYERAFQIAEVQDRYLRKVKGHPAEAGLFGMTLTALGNISLQLGEKQKALDYFYQALPYWNIARHNGPQTFGVARANRGLSQVYASLRDTEKALTYAQQALKYSRDTVDFIGQVEALNILGGVYSADQNPERAIESFKEALQISLSTGDRNGQAKALANLGYLYFKMGMLTSAEKSFADALNLFGEIQNPGGEARAMTGMGMVVRTKGELKRAVELYTQALPLLEHTIDREGEAETLYELAQTQVELGELFAARESIEKAINQIEFVRRSFAGTDLRASYRSATERYYELYIRLLMRLHEQNPNAGYDVLAFEQSDLSRARGLLESLREAGLNIRESANPQLLRREQELQQLLIDKGNRADRNKGFTPEQKAAAEREIDNLIDELRRVRGDISASSPRYAALTQPKRLTLADIREKALDTDTVLLAYELGEERSFLWLATSNSLFSYQLPQRSVVEAMARPFYRAASSDRSGKEVELSAGKLSEMLLAPVAEQIRGKRLLIVADGILQYIPFAALPDPSAPVSARPLILDHQIVSLPSASTLVELRTERRLQEPRDKSLAVFADPVFSSNDSRVRRGPQSAPIQKQEETRSLGEIQFDLWRREFDGGEEDIPRLQSTRLGENAISKSIPTQKRMVALDFDASRATALTGNLGEYQIVHFATHGLLDSRRPELSGLVLSLVDRDGRPTNGFLQMHEIYNLKLPVELVVLSACRTALGAEVKGEGLVGVTRGFMYAGAPRVVSSLWEVDSKATAELMTQFYREMLNNKLAPAAALRAAQVRMSQTRRWQSPYFWAGFVLQGEYR